MRKSPVGAYTTGAQSVTAFFGLRSMRWLISRRVYPIERLVIRHLLNGSVRPRGTRKAFLLLIDMNHLKKFNDEHEHLLISGYVLKFVPNKIRKPVKERDFLARFEGEEFAVILPKAS